MIGSKIIINLGKEMMRKSILLYPCCNPSVRTASPNEGEGVLD
jgi:hypothetical protein